VTRQLGGTVVAVAHRYGHALIQFVQAPRHPRLRRAGTALGILAVAMAGMALGVLLAGRVSADVGPFRAEFSVTPSVSGGTDVSIPPLGSLHLDSHGGPAHLSIQLAALDQKRTTALVTNPNALAQASGGAVDDLQNGMARLALQVAGVSVLGAMGLATIVYRSMRRVATAGGIAMLVLGGTAIVSLGTFRPAAIEEPRYEGLLVNAPAVVGDARRIAGRYEAYRAELQRLVGNVGKLYDTVSTLPVYEPDNSTIRVLHISDMHLNPAAWSVVRTVVQQFNVNVIIDTGDMTDWGSEPEDSYVASIAALKVPYVYIRGNHDSPRTAAAVGRQPNAKVIDGGSPITVDGLTIVGIGDPRFTPDKSSAANAPGSDDAGTRAELNAGEALSTAITGMGKPPDIALVHDPVAATPLAGQVPLVLAGHTHKRDVRRLATPDGTAPDAARTLLMTEGSTGGAGLRGLENKEPLPLALSVLYFDQKHVLQAYDDISVGGTGQTEVTLQRHIVKDDKATPASPSPSPSAS
jgi:predicted phosphodiesterase